jgi:hypothetical protein
MTNVCKVIVIEKPERERPLENADIVWKRI